jgi:phenylalanyl-tRNA synthetase alpha chain
MSQAEGQKGHIHPISSLVREANQIFYSMGFTLAEGPLLESEQYNFDALNFQKDHPARDMQDTFFVKDEPGMVLRTHTSNVQVRYMEEQIKKGVTPPYRMVSIGKVFRNEATDMTHEAEFYQVEGMVIGKDISVAHLRGTLEQFFSKLMKGQVEVRFRPSFFPFVEPGLEVDMRLVGDNVPEKLKGRWIEVMGAGMVHPNVLKNAGVDPAQYQGFAFGGGVDRLAILRWGIDDIRLMHSGDLRFVNQF